MTEATAAVDAEPSGPMPETLPKPFSFRAMMQELSGREPSASVNFDPPKMAALTKPLEALTLGVFASCGVYHHSQDPFAATNDLSYRLVSREIPTSDLILGHQAAIRYYATQDLNVAYPRERLLELEAAGVIGRIAPYTVSMVGAVSAQEELLQETVPAVFNEFQNQKVDLVLLLPFCPACHTTVPLIARALEKRGMPTVMTSCLWERIHEYKPPRVGYLDFPMGCPAGKPNEPELQRQVLTAALRAAYDFQDSWGLAELPFSWDPGRSRAWEDEVRGLYVADAEAFAKRADNLAEQRGTVAGQEREFAIRCAC
jgi:D-proline reductase (dithiol) PrdB